MTMIKCHECGYDFSDQASACPKCGAPPAKKQMPSMTQALKRPLTRKDWAAAAIVVIAGIWLLWPSSEKPSAQQATKAEEKQCKKDDLQCLGDKGFIAAGVYCPREIEKLAAHSVRWTDGAFEFKFSRLRWRDQPNGVITYIGDRAEFQNGFGAYTPVIYECDLSSDNKSILAVRAHEGRLP